MDEASETAFMVSGAAVFEEVRENVGMIDLYPAGGIDFLPLAKGVSGDARVCVPDGGAVVLGEGDGFEGERVEVRFGPGKFHSGDGLQEGGETEPFDLWAPVEEAVVLGGGSELDVFGGEVDEAICCAAHIVAAWGGVVVIVGADPALGVDDTFEHAFEVDRVTSDHLDFAGEVAVLDAAGDNDAVTTGGDGDFESAVFVVVLVAATMGTLIGSEVHGFGSFECEKLGFAGDGDSLFVGDLETDAALRAEVEVGVCFAVGFDLDIPFDVSAALGVRGDPVFSLFHGELEGSVFARVSDSSEASVAVWVVGGT